MEDDTDWNPEKIDEAMHAGKKNGTHLKQNSGLYRLFYRLARHRRNFIFYDDVIREA
jgi:hypothetical protein